MKIVFMGTPGFAVGILDKLLTEKQNIVGVVTVADKPAGRGQQVSESAVKQYAVQHDLPVLQPVSLKDENFIAQLKEFDADLFVVVAFRMLPELVWNMPPKGTINLHASLLPYYRGAAPINWAIINGESKTGVTTFFIEQEIDTGLVIEQESVEIAPNETAGELHDRLLNLGRELVYSSVQKIENGTVSRTPQEQLAGSEELPAAPKIFKAMCAVDWNKTAQEVHNHCRGLSPYPTAWTSISDDKGNARTIKIFKTELTSQKVSDPKKVLTSKTELLLPCSDYYLQVLELQPEGKRRMQTKEFLAGYGQMSWFLT